METWVATLEDDAATMPVPPEAKQKRHDVSAWPGRALPHRSAASAQKQQPGSTGGDDATTVLGRLAKVLVALGGGTGVVMQETMLPGLRQDYESRSRYQNDALLFLIATAYFVAICLGLSYLRWRVENRSPITFYADPAYAATAMEGHDVVSFLATFNQAPKQVLLQVTGFLLTDDSLLGGMEWEEERYHVAFTFALDLSPWLVREEWAHGEDCCSGASKGGASRQPLLDGIAAEELESLRQFLALDNNDLATVLLHKEVAWPGWEELAINIRQRIKQCGFTGILSIQCGRGETVTVHKNRPWANFLHNRATCVLCMLSAVGWPVYHAYMWMRCTQLPIHARFRVDIATADYWPFIADKLSASGFDTTAGSTGGSG